MNYEINISKNGIHFFATHERSVSSSKKLKEIYPILKEKFPEEEGYLISVTKYERIGKVILMEEETND